MRILSCVLCLPLFVILSLPAQAQQTDLVSGTVPGNGPVTPITPSERVKWAVGATVGGPALLGGAISAGWNTLYNSPSEYGPHWEGFAKRYASGTANNAVSNTMEASLGMIWGEDPRYFRAGSGPVKSRIGNVVKFAFMAKNRNGNNVPAYARYMAYTGSSFIARTWQPPSNSGTGDVVVGIGFDFVSELTGNTVREFWPDVKRKIFRK